MVPLNSKSLPLSCFEKIGSTGRADRQKNGRGATLNVAHRDGRIITWLDMTHSADMQSQDIRSSAISGSVSWLCRHAVDITSPPHSPVILVFTERNRVPKYRSSVTALIAGGGVKFGDLLFLALLLLAARMTDPCYQQLSVQFCWSLPDPARYRHVSLWDRLLSHAEVCRLLTVGAFLWRISPQWKLHRQCCINNVKIFVRGMTTRRRTFVTHLSSKWIKI